MSDFEKLDPLVQHEKRHGGRERADCSVGPWGQIIDQRKPSDGGSGGNGKSSPGANSGAVGRGVGAGVG